MGGDEFGIILWNKTGDAVPPVSQRLSDTVRVNGLGHDLDIGLSIGAAVLTSGMDVSTARAEADSRVYEAKARK